MDDVGNILIKRVSKSAVRVKNTTEESAVSNDILKQPGGLLENDKPFKVSRKSSSSSSFSSSSSSSSSLKTD